MTTEAPLTNDVSPRKSSLTGWGLMSVLLLLSIVAYPLLDGVVPRSPPGSAPQNDRYLAIRESLESLRSGDLIVMRAVNGSERVHAVMKAGVSTLCTRDSVRADQYCISMDSTEILAFRRVCGVRKAPAYNECALRFFDQ